MGEIKLTIEPVALGTAQNGLRNAMRKLEKNGKSWNYKNTKLFKALNKFWCSCIFFTIVEPVLNEGANEVKGF